MDEVTLFLTSCGRPDLLRVTLESFVKFNTFPIKEAIICEDSGPVGSIDFVRDILPFSTRIIYNNRRIGQMRSIENGVKFITTPYVFHCEEDWEFIRSGFIELSFKIMASDSKISQVLLRDIKNYSTIDIGNDLCYKTITQEGWSMYSFNPSLRTVETQKLNIPYKDFDDEFTIQATINRLGYFAVIPKGYPEGFVKHIGDLNHVWPESNIKYRTDFPEYSDSKKFMNMILNSMEVCKRDVKFLVDTSDTQNLFFWKDIFEKHEGETFEIFDKYGDQNKVMIDLGIWVGSTVLYNSKKYKHVYGVEADQKSVEVVKNNIKLNGINNITVIPKAIYNKNTTVSFGHNMFRDSTDNDSMNQIRPQCDGRTNDIQAITLHQLLCDTGLTPSDIGLIKVDIEGGEENIMEDLLNFYLQYKVPMYISFHYVWWKDRSYLYSLKDTFAKCRTDRDVLSSIPDDPMGSVLFF